MATNDVKIVVTAVDKASATLKQTSSGLSKLGGTFKELTGFGLGAASAVGLAGVAIQKTIQFTKEAINETVEYNKQVREMTQVTGLGAEEISRIVQVGDDWGVSIESIRTSLAFMNKQGVTPSIDNLAKLADEYVASSDKAAFAERAVKVLGRGYQTLIPLLALGGDGLRDATGAIKDNMIVTDESIKTSREYEVAVDDLTDAWQGFKYEIGNKVIPTDSAI